MTLVIAIISIAFTVTCCIVCRVGLAHSTMAVGPELPGFGFKNLWAGRKIELPGQLNIYDFRDTSQDWNFWLAGNNIKSGYGLSLWVFNFFERYH